MSKKDIIICRCEDITLEDIHNCLKEGYTTFEEIKRILRVGMGPCQGQTCSVLIQREIATYINKPLEDVKTHKTRPLIAGVVLNDIVGGTDE